MKNKKEYKTSDFYLAAYLLASKVKLIKIEKEDPRRALFVFEDSKKIKSLIEGFLFDTSTIKAKGYSLAIKELKRMLYTQI